MKKQINSEPQKGALQYMPKTEIKKSLEAILGHPYPEIENDKEILQTYSMWELIWGVLARILP